MFVVICFHSGHKRQQNDYWSKKQGLPKRQNTGQGFLSGGYPKKHELIDLLFISHVFSTSKEMFGNLLFKHNPSSQERTPVLWACRRASQMVHKHQQHQLQMDKGTGAPAPPPPPDGSGAPAPPAPAAPPPDGSGAAAPAAPAADGQDAGATPEPAA